MPQSYLQTCRYVYCIPIMLKPQTLYESSDATVRALAVKMVGASKINIAYRFFFLHHGGEKKLFDFCLYLSDVHFLITQLSNDLLKIDSKKAF